MFEVNPQPSYVWLKYMLGVTVKIKLVSLKYNLCFKTHVQFLLLQNSYRSIEI